MKVNSLNQAIFYSVHSDCDGSEIDADFEISVNGETWKCYTVAISHRDILCYCNEGTASFAVDTYHGSRDIAELVDWDDDQQQLLL